MTAAVALSDLVVGMSRRGTPLASETGLFIALQATEALLDGPTRVSAREVRITPEGDVSVARGRPSAEPATVASVAALLETVIAPAPLAVRALIERARSGQVKTLAALRAEIEALLVPLNRSAARRVLGRLARELRRVELASAPAAPAPDDAGEAARRGAPAAPRSPRAAHAPEPATALQTLPGAPPAATDTLPDGAPRLPAHATDTCATVSDAGVGDATDTDPDGPALGDALRTASERAWALEARGELGSDRDAGDAYDADGDATDPAEADLEAEAEAGIDTAARAADDFDPGAALDRPRGGRGVGAGLTLCVLLALLGAAYAWQRTTTAATASSVIHATQR